MLHHEPSAVNLTCRSGICFCAGLRWTARSLPERQNAGVEPLDHVAYTLSFNEEDLLSGLYLTLSSASTCIRT